MTRRQYSAMTSERDLRQFMDALEEKRRVVANNGTALPTKPDEIVLSALWNQGK